MYSSSPEALFVVWLSFVLSLTAHAFGHITIKGCFDRKYKNKSRNTRSPFMHVSVISMLVGLLFGFMWAKPVFFNNQLEKNKPMSRQIAFHLGGIGMNLLLVAVLTLARGIMTKLLGEPTLDNTTAAFFLYRQVGCVISANLFVALISLLPLPGLDGFNLLWVFAEKNGVQIKRKALYLVKTIVLSLSVLYLFFSLLQYRYPLYEQYQALHRALFGEAIHSHIVYK